MCSVTALIPLNTSRICWLSGPRLCGMHNSESSRTMRLWWCYVLSIYVCFYVVWTSYLMKYINDINTLCWWSCFCMMIVLSIRCMAHVINVMINRYGAFISTCCVCVCVLWCSLTSLQHLRRGGGSQPVSTACLKTLGFESGNFQQFTWTSWPGYTKTETTQNKTRRQIQSRT